MKSPFWDFLIISLIYFIFVAIRVLFKNSKVKKKSELVITKDILETEEGLLEGKKLAWLFDKYFLKFIDVKIELSPMKTLIVLTLLTMLEMYFIYAVIV